MKNHKTNQNSNKTQEVFDKIVNNLKAIVESGEYEKFLKFQKNFRGYSFNNLILIYSQFPDATQVAGKSKWLKMKRELIPNARKIFIIAPIPRSYMKKVKVMEEGEETEKELLVKYNAYRYVYVYDISQTTGADMPLDTKPLNNNTMGEFYEKLKLFSKVPVVEEELTGATQGYYSKNQNKIVIKSNLSEDDKVATLLHELTHSLYDDFDYKKDRDLSEVFVESVAFITADHFGLDTSRCSFNYILGWANGETNTVIELGSKIQKYANKLIEEIENFNAQNAQLAA